MVDCIQPPSKTPTPNRTTNNPLADISSSFPVAAPGDRLLSGEAAINRKNRVIATISDLSTVSFW
jgi:hypothetical protein